MSTSSKDYTVKTVLKAIKGCGGIVSTVAKRLNCDWNTADKYIKMYDETKQAMSDEKETILDMSESAIYGSVKMALRDIENGVQPNTQDAKWILARLGKKRGFGDSVELDHNISDEAYEKLKNLYSDE